MATVKITKTIEAEQWLGPGSPLPKGCFDCQVEVHWSHGRQMVYFTYAKLNPQHWMGVKKLPIPENPGTGLFDKSYCVFTPANAGLEGEPYARESLPFAFWKVKSEASMNRDHRAVYLDMKDPEQVELFHNYASMERWENPITQYAEYREIDGGYGRGFRPHYIPPKGWLLKEPVDGQIKYRAVTDDEFRLMGA